MLTFIDAEFGANGVLRRYQHPRLGLVTVVTMYGTNGDADIVNLDGALQCAQAMLRFADRERKCGGREQKKRPRRGGPKPQKTAPRATTRRKPEACVGEPASGPPGAA